MTISSEPFGSVKGVPVELYTMRNPGGIEVQVTNFGGAVTSIKVPDRDGNLADVVLGYDTFGDYANDPNYFGAICGRYANRIARGRFDLDGVAYDLAINNAPNHLHGGNTGFDKRVWKASSARVKDGVAITLRYDSPDGEENYPGNLKVVVTYVLTKSNDLRIEYSAQTDEATPVNLTHHGYFNLRGAGNGTIAGHELTIEADRYTPTDKTLIPTGELAPVEGTPFDFRKAKPIGRDIGDRNDQLSIADGYDQNFVLNGGSSRRPALAATVREPRSGRKMEVFTTEPGIQLYTANHLDGNGGRRGESYSKYGAFCLEAQHFPDSPNQEGFPSTILRPGDEYTQTTVYRFSVDD
ncbi:MAG: aldose epimerase family protein [Verrucomicrobiota bacterium]